MVAGAAIAAGMRVRVRASVTLCPGREGVVRRAVKAASRRQAAARGGRWCVGLDRIYTRDTTPRFEWYWGDQLEPVEGVA